MDLPVAREPVRLIRIMVGKGLLGEGWEDEGDGGLWVGGGCGEGGRMRSRVFILVKYTDLRI